jgi:hypothetical protein
VQGAKIAAGTMAIAGFVDITGTDYTEILAADLDGKKRIFRVTLPDNGFLIAEGTIGGLTWQVPLDGAIAFSATITLASAPKHRY